MLNLPFTRNGVQRPPRGSFKNSTTTLLTPVHTFFRYLILFLWFGFFMSLPWDPHKGSIPSSPRGRRYNKFATSRSFFFEPTRRKVFRGDQRRDNRTNLELSISASWDFVRFSRVISFHRIHYMKHILFSWTKDYNWGVEIKILVYWSVSHFKFYDRSKIK